jgi:hypothetical protein
MENGAQCANGRFSGAADARVRKIGQAVLYLKENFV